LRRKLVSIRFPRDLNVNLLSGGFGGKGRTLAFRFMVGTSFHHYLFTFGFGGEGRVPWVVEGGGVEGGGEVKAANGQNKEPFDGHGNRHIGF
jgi:hypothetical protein